MTADDITPPESMLEAHPETAYFWGRSRGRERSRSPA